MPATISAEERRVLKPLLKKPVTKPMKGRWGSFEIPRRKFIRVAKATRDRHVLGRLFRIGLGRTLREAYEREAEDDAPAPIQEEEDFGKRLRVRLRHSVEDLCEDRFCVEVFVSDTCDAQVSHMLNYLQAKVHKADGTTVHHILDMCTGKCEEWVTGTLQYVDRNMPVWDVLGPYIGAGGRDPVSEQEVDTMIMSHCVLISAEVWRRFVMHYRSPKFALVPMLQAPEAADQPSQIRKDAAERFLWACHSCLGFGMENVREVVYDLLEWCVANEGRVHPDLLHFVDRLYKAWPVDTQDVEGENSKIKRIGWISRAGTFGRTAKKMNNKSSTQVPYPEYLKLYDSAKGALKGKVFPFTPARFAEVAMQPCTRLPPRSCEHIANDRIESGEAVAKALDPMWELLWVMRVGDTFYLNCGTHFGRSGVARLRTRVQEARCMKLGGGDVGFDWFSKTRVLKFV